MKNSKILQWSLFFLFLASIPITILVIKLRESQPIDLRAGISLDKKVDLALDIASTRLLNTIFYLEKRAGQPGKIFPEITRTPPSNNPIYQRFPNLNKRPQSLWTYTPNTTQWANGAFPALLWKMYLEETNPTRKELWRTKAKIWSESLRENNYTRPPKDMTINNLFVFKHWYENGNALEKTQQLNTIFQGAKILVTPYQDKHGNFNNKLNTFGYLAEANRDQQVYWHVFIDHIINVEQLFYAAENNPNSTEANYWRTQALQHIKTVSQTFEKSSNPVEIRVWQRGYFDNNSNSDHYGQFLFVEGKQGWQDNSVWSRGQAWFIYASCITYQYTGDQEVLATTKGAINYFLNHLPDQFPQRLRRQGDFIPPWDFDYALKNNPDTNRDSSAAAIAIAGIIKLLKVLPQSDPDWQIYFKSVQNILEDLTSSQYLPEQSDLNASILKHGCYVHPQSMIGQSGAPCDNGLIWGDYFFVDALQEYRLLVQSANGN
jgi:hypothetical protein